MSKPPVSREEHQIFLQLQQRNASVNEYRAELASYYSHPQWQRCTVPPLFVPWHDLKLYHQFIMNLKDANMNSEEQPSSSGLSKRFELISQNFEERLKYYSDQGHLKSCVDFLQDLHDGGHTVYLIMDQEEVNTQRAYTIGVHYWYPECTEFLLSMDVGNELSQQVIFSLTGKILNYLAEVVKSAPNSIQAGTKVKHVLPFISNDAVVFDEITPEERQLHLGTAKWFYINFADSFDFPCLKLHLGQEEVSEFLTSLSEIEQERGSLMNQIYEHDSNVVYLKHGPVSTIPDIELASNSAMLDFIELAMKVSEKEFENKTSVSSLDELNRAAGGCSLEKLKTLIKNHPSFNIVNKDSFEYAMWNDKIDTMHYLIQKGLNLKGDGNDRTLLMNAVQYGHEEAVKILLKANAPLNDRDCENWTCLSIASRAVLHTDMALAKRIMNMLWESGAREM
ncbi:hypothetical protein C9374_008980 [Naegleria lovaniensis]|uniref:Ankyrin repeat protein n=1 Tax=Naegleria lovaniensis TaxID=51637 RepID=A0AA88GIV5_NAELO|nr:uncharacterized protein C9374_008980 [Naegleria lovaniensis]KAG2377895.1 hypothetical protein C9374_008980 [Naegleria lovaniensis]